METILTKTASNGSTVVISFAGTTDLAAFIDGRQVSAQDAFLAYPKPVKAPNGLMIGGYLRDAKIGLTVDEAQAVKAAVDARNTARLTAMRRAMNSPIARNQPDDLGYEMSREDSAW